MAALLPILTAILGNAGVISLGVKLIEDWMAKNQADKDAQAAMVLLCQKLQALGAQGLKSRFDQEAEQKSAGDEAWSKQEAAKAQEKKP